MRTVVRDDESGVSEVVGTILILAMTVVLFSSIIVWVTSIPTPSAQTRLDVQGTMDPICNAQGYETGFNVTLLHNGGESLGAFSTAVYLTYQIGSGVATTDNMNLKMYTASGSGTMRNGLLDGTGATWSIGERWFYTRLGLGPNIPCGTVVVSVTVVDTGRGTVVWSGQLSPLAGSRPPVFLNVWASRSNIPNSPLLTPESGVAFYILAKVTDPDGNLDPNSVTANMSFFWGSPGDPCSVAQKMYDDGRNGGHQDAAVDGVFTLFKTSCMNTPSLDLDGSYVLFTAKDLNGHTTSTRLLLHLVEGPGGPSGSYPPGAQPPNLHWSGDQGYNIFNASEWDTRRYNATETRTFYGGDTVVVVVGSRTLLDVLGIDSFYMWDPYSGIPQQPVVYYSTNPSQTVTGSTLPSSTSAFSFLQTTNTYFIYTYRFKLNDPEVGGQNFYTVPPSWPHNYYYAKYPLSILLTSRSGVKFTATDSITVTAGAGSTRNFPSLQVYTDSAFTKLVTTSNPLRSTDTMYVQVGVQTVDPSPSTVAFGNVIIQDYQGDSQLWRAPTNGYLANLPICAVSGSCSPSTAAISVFTNGVVSAYRFAVQLARANQDPWIAGTQNYSFSIASVRDSDNIYGSVSTQITVSAPLYKMDAWVGSQEAAQNAWGTNNYAYFFQDYNGLDFWKAQRADYCAQNGLSTSGVSAQGNSPQCPSSNKVLVAVGDINNDGSLDLAESFIGQNTNPTSIVVIYRYSVDASGAVTYLPVFSESSFAGSPCTALQMADVTGDGAPEVLCGGNAGKVWYYTNNGNWTPVWVDNPTSGSNINSITVGDFNGDGLKDIAVGGAGGYLRYYPNLGSGRFQNVLASDNWFPVAEQNITGSIVAGTYLDTYTANTVYDQIQERWVDVPLAFGATVNGAFDTSGANWTFAQITGGATGTYQAVGGLSTGYAQIQTTAATGSVIAGYWYQPFTTKGSAPFSATASLAYKLISNGATGAGTGVRFYAFVDSTSAAPPLNPVAGQYIWTSGVLTTPTGWANVLIPSVNITGKITTSGATYYLKVAMYTTFGATGGTSVGGFDNVQLQWTSTAGPTSAMAQYWRINTLPSRPGTSFTFYVTGHQSLSLDGDNFVFAFSSNVVGGIPTGGTYTDMVTLSSVTDRTLSFTLPTSVSGKVVWIRATDTNRTVEGQTSNALDSLYVDQMYINAYTPAGATGATLTNPGDSSAVNSINAWDQNGDGYADLIVATANGHLFKYMGSGGWLQPPAACYYSTGAGGSCSAAGPAFVKVRWGNFNATYPGLEVAAATSTAVFFFRGDVTSGTASPFYSGLTIAGASITALAVGDVNGDGVDDVMIGTSASVNTPSGPATVVLWENLHGGVAWTYAIPVYNTASAVFSVVVGDSVNALYVGR